MKIKIMPNLKVLIVDSTHPVLKNKLSSAGFDCYYYPEITKKEIETSIHKYNGIIIRSKIKIDKKLIDKAQNLKFIGRAGSGMENIDTEYAQKKGIRCFNSPEGCRDAVGEHALGMLLFLFNNLCKANYEVKQGKWQREANRGIEIMSKTIGIIGYGNTGSAFAQRLKGFDVRVISYDKYKNNYSDEYVTESTLEDIFRETDILSLHIPLTEETEFIVNNTFINKFKKNIYLINTSRGKIIKTDDLVESIEKGKILGCALDVLEYESTSFEELHGQKMPDALTFLINSDKVVLSPHIAGLTFESAEKSGRVLADKIISYLSLI